MRFKLPIITVQRMQDIDIEDVMASFVNNKTRRLKYLGFYFNCCLEGTILHFMLRTYHGLLPCTYRLHCFEASYQQHLLEGFQSYSEFFKNIDV